MRKILLPFLIVSLGLASCKKEKEDISEINEGYKFMPLEIGKYILYDVDSTYWDGQTGDGVGVPIPTASQVRYSVEDTFRDAGGRLSYRITVLTRNTTADPFRPNDVVYATPTENGVEYSQKNVTYIKLTFPVAEGRSWNGNAMIPSNDDYYKEYHSDKWRYTYANFDKDYDLGIRLFNHTVTVNHIDDQLNDPDTDSTAYAYRNFSQEVYAYNVGLIYRERVYWEFQPKVGSSGGSGKRKGYAVRMRAVDHN